MEIPYLYKEGPRRETRVRFRVGDINLEGNPNLQEIL